MYNNENLLELLERAREGYENEYHDLMLASYDVMCRGIGASDYYRKFALYNYENIHEAVADNIIRCMDRLIRLYDADRGMSIMTYLLNGFLLSIKQDYYKNRNRKEKNVRRFEHAKDTFQEYEDLLDQIHDAEDTDYRISCVMDIIRTLPLNQQDVVEGFLRGETLRETAIVMGITHQRVQQVRMHIMKVIRQRLKKQFGEHIFE